MTEAPQYKTKLSTRILSTRNMTVGGDSSLSFMRENNNHSKTLLALEIPFKIDAAYPEILATIWQNKTLSERVDFADKTQCDIISIKFNISEENLEKELLEIENLLPSIFSTTDKQIILRGANIKNVDKVLLPLLAQKAPEDTIIAFADDTTYEEIATATAQYGQILVLRSPIDINLAKELNILAKDKGMSLDRLLIDPDMGALGYGLDYGYSIVEKIKLSAFEGDPLLNMPIIVFAGEEAFKAKEAKSPNFDKNWGDYETRAKMWELATAAPMISAGANIVVLWHPESIITLKEVLK